MTRQVSIAPDAIIGSGVSIGPGTSIGPGCIIYDSVTIGSNCVIGPRVTLGEPTRSYYKSESHSFKGTSVGDGATIRSGTTIYDGCRIGKGLETGHSVFIREETVIGENCSIGTLCDFQGFLSVGSHCRFHSNVHIGQYSTIDDYVWIFPYVVLTNDPHPPCGRCLKGPTIGKYSVIATKAVILPGVKIGEDVLVGAMALVTRDLSDGRVYAGVPARDVGDVRDIKCKKGIVDRPYPWRFHRLK